MVSTLLSPKSLALVLIVFTVFTVSLTETLQLADAKIEHVIAGQQKIFEMAIGETELQLVNLTNLKAEGDIIFEVYAVGAGSEFLLFEEYTTVGPKTTKEFEVFVIIPKDHPDNIEYHPQIKVLKRAPQLEEGVTGIRVNIQQTIPVIIKIGDSPIFTAPEVEVIAEVPEEKPIKEQPKVAAPAPVVETIEEKMKRIQAANKANTAVMGETPAEATGQFEVEDPVPELQVDDNYLEEPTESSTTDILVIAEECDFITWLMSLFGMAKC